MKKQILQELKKNDGFNPCPHCGQMPWLFINEDGEHRLGCKDCVDNNFAVQIESDQTLGQIEYNRWSWNVWNLGNEYTDEAMQRIGLHTADHVIADASNGNIVCYGDADTVFSYLKEEYEKNIDMLYLIYMLIGKRLYSIGTSYLVGLAWQHIEEKQNE